MPSTTRGYRYPSSADDVRPYEDIQFLATDVDADVGAIALRGFVAEVNNNSTPRNSTTAEAIGNTVTLTSPGTTAIYKATYVIAVQSSVAADICRLRIRYQSGVTLTSAGTQARVRTLALTVTGQAVTLVATITGLAAGQWTIGGSIARAAGTGTNSINANGTDEEYLLIERTN
jgi:hypothetical protein